MEVEGPPGVTILLIESPTKAWWDASIKAWWDAPVTLVRFGLIATDTFHVRYGLVSNSDALSWADGAPFVPVRTSLWSSADRLFFLVEGTL